MNVRELSYWDVVGETCSVSQQFAVIVVFVAIFVRLHERLLPPYFLIFASCISTLVLYIWWSFAIWLPDSKSLPLWNHPSNTFPSYQSHWFTYWCIAIVFNPFSSVFLFVTVLLGLTPILKNLTKDISSDSIWFMTTLMFLANLLFHDYGSSFSTHTRFSLSSLSYLNKFSPKKHALFVRFPDSLSINAAICASVLLASRLSSNMAVFSLMLFAVQLFALFPILRRSIRVKYSLSFITIHMNSKKPPLDLNFLGYFAFSRVCWCMHLGGFDCRSIASVL